jgi:hypothetical protein
MEELVGWGLLLWGLVCIAFHRDEVEEEAVESVVMREKKGAGASTACGGWSKSR